MWWLRSRRKGPPCFGFVSKSAHTVSVGQYLISRSPLAILSRMKKYLHLMCFFCLELNTEPLTSSCMVDWLSWKRMFCSEEYPCASMKFCVWRIRVGPGLLRQVLSLWSFWCLICVCVRN